jgi:hypothetical protein
MEVPVFPRVLSTPALLIVLVGCKPLMVPPCSEDSETACFRGVFKTLLGAPIDGMEVCAPELPDIDCTLTDENGGWRMPGLPRDTDVVLTAEHEKYVPSAFPQNTEMSWYDWYKVGVPKSTLEMNANRLDVEQQAGTGSVLFLTWEGLNHDGIDTPNVRDVALQVRGGDGRVFYANGIGLADKNATATQGSGLGGILNLEPGIVKVRLEGPAGMCGKTPIFHYPADADGWIPVPVLKGWNTAIDVQCPVAP